MKDDFTLEKLRIAEKLDEVATALAVLMNSQKNITDLLSKHESSLYGDGNGRLGMNVRIDRLEQDLETRKWHFRTLWGMIIGMFAKLIHLTFK